MSDTFQSFRSTVVQSAFYSMGNFLGKFSGVILLPIYLLYLPVEVFGLYALFEVIFQLFQVFSGLGVKLGFARWYWDDESTPNKKSLFYTTYVFNAVVCVVFSILLFVGFDFLSQYYFKTYISSYSALLFIVGNLIRLLSEVPLLLLRAQHRAKKHSVVQMVQLLLFVLFTYIFLSWFKMQLDGIFWAIILSGLFQFIMLLPVVISNSQAKFDSKILKDILMYGFPVALGNMVNVLFNFTDKYFINIFSDLKNVGTFTLAHKVSNIVNLLIVNSFMNAYMHSYFKTVQQKDGDDFFSRSFTYFLLVLSFCSMLVILFIEEAMMLFDAESSDYSGSIVLVPVLTIGLIFGGIRQMLTLPLNKIKKSKAIGILSVMAGLLNVLLNYLFIPTYYALGAAYATGIVQVLSSGVLLYYGLKYAQLKLEWKRVAMLFASFTVSVLPLYFYRFDKVFINIVYKLVLILVWVLILYYSGFLYPSERGRIISFWNKWRNLNNFKSNMGSLKDQD